MFIINGCPIVLRIVCYQSNTYRALLWEQKEFLRGKFCEVLVKYFKSCSENDKLYLKKETSLKIVSLRKKSTITKLNNIKLPLTKLIICDWLILKVLDNGFMTVRKRSLKEGLGIWFLRVGSGGYGLGKQKSFFRCPII